MTTPKPCETCQFFTRIEGESSSVAVCKRDGRAGGYRHIPFERTDPGLCGPDGRFWLERDASVVARLPPAGKPRLRLVGSERDA